MPALLKTTQIQEPSSSTVNVTLPSSGGGVTINGTTSGGVTVAVPAVAGSNTVTLPAATGTALVSSTAISTAITGTPSASTYLRGDGAWAAVSASGQLIRAPQILTSGTSYTTPSNCTSIYIWAVGGGGNGGNATRNGTTGAVAGGGGAGATCMKYFTVTGSTAYTYAIGAATGNTTFTVGATTVTAGGGSSGGNATDGSSGGGSGGTATNGDLNNNGISGGSAAFTAPRPTGEGGNSFFGGGGPVLYMENGDNAVSATGYGSGGSGAARSTPGTTNGGAGRQGVIIVWEYT